MSDLLFLNDPKHCPRCGKRSVRFDLRRCIQCDARLLKPDDTFRALLDEGLRSFYVFFPANGENFRGWVHSGHLEKPEPLAIDWKPEDPGKDYGKSIDVSDRPLPV